MIEVSKKEYCCGCNACGDVCVHKAISFKTDLEGFWYPEVDKEKCVDCHLCEKVCPIINIKELKKNEFEQPVCYAAQCKNLQSLFDSTSGSAFATLAERMYKNGGYVGGAVFNEYYSEVTQFISADKADLEKIRNSKYVQSNSEGFFIAVRDLLKAGERVLVCGLPCQMAGLRSFLRKDYENLIIIDLFCLGINSPKILRGYLDYMEEKHGSKVVYYKAKNKELGWRQLTTKLVFENGDVEYDKKGSNYFTHGFIGTHAYSRPSCYECHFKGFPRIADITIGDFWGAERVVGKDYDHDLGTSAIFLNNKKGMDFFESAKSSFKCVEIPLDTVLKGNLPLTQSLSRPSIDREQFYQDLNTLKFQDFADKYIHLPDKQALSVKGKLKNLTRFAYHTVMASGFSLSTWWKNIHYNLFSRVVKTDILNGKSIVIHRHCVLDISKKGKIVLNGCLSLGYKRVKGSKLETRLLVDPGATLIVGNCSIGYGADIEVFTGATLELGSGLIFNINSTIICGENIKIGDDTFFGRDVTVRDNNGGHFMSRRVYKDKRPVVIGQHCWICEHSMVMPGAKLGAGVVVSANSVVYGKLPNFVLAKGDPAEVMDEDIYWKQ